jgi:predicted MPP superfamily phosphohydrolase
MLLAREKPDYILLPGDILDDWTDPRPAYDFLRGAAQIAPAFYCPGNHEYRTGHIRTVFRDIERCGVTVLADQAVHLDTPSGSVTLAGAEDEERRLYGDPGYSPLKAAKAAFAGLKRDPGLRILLVHRPERAALYKPFGFDLAVSGHAHGGQARIPFLLNGLYAPGQGFFPTLAGGLYDRGDFHHLVSRGAGWNPLLPRVFNPPELVILDAIGGKSSL